MLLCHPPHARAHACARVSLSSACAAFSTRDSCGPKRAHVAAWARFCSVARARLIATQHARARARPAHVSWRGSCWEGAQMHWLNRLKRSSSGTAVLLLMPGHETAGNCKQKRDAASERIEARIACDVRGMLTLNDLPEQPLPAGMLFIQWAAIDWLIMQQFVPGQAFGLDKRRWLSTDTERNFLSNLKCQVVIVAHSSLTLRSRWK